MQFVEMQRKTKANLLLQLSIAGGLKVLKIVLNSFQVFLQRSLDAVDVGGEAVESLLEALAVLPALGVQLLPLLGDPPLGVRGEGVQKLLQDRKLFVKIV